MVNGHSFILIRQMAALVKRRALAEVCTVPVLLVVTAAFSVCLAYIIADELVDVHGGPARLL